MAILTAPLIWAKSDKSQPNSSGTVETNSPNAGKGGNAGNESKNNTPVKVNLDNTSTNQYLPNTLKKMEKVQQRVTNKALDQQFKEMENEQVRAEEKIGGSLEKMKARPGFLKFMLGPDYKNAGEVRSQVVKLRNQIKQLTRLRERQSGTAQTAIDETIASLKTELAGIENRLYESLKGFSLLGWLNKLLSNYEPLPTPTPTPTGTPTTEPTAEPSPSVAPLSPTPTI